MTTDELISTLQDLDVPTEESATLVSMVAEKGWTDDVKARVLLVIDEYTALKQEETGVLEKTQDILATRDEEIEEINADAADDITDAADAADAAIKAVEDGLGEIDAEFSSQVAASESAPAAAPAADAAPVVEQTMTPAPAAPVAPVASVVPDAAAPAAPAPVQPIQPQPFNQ